MTFKDLEHFFSDFFYRISSFKKYLLLLISVFLFLLFYILFSNQISQIISPQMDNIDDLTKLKRFEILKKYFIERYQSPYTKRKYTIQNNDSIEKILNNYLKDGKTAVHMD